METAVERWETLLNERARQMDAAYAHLGRTSADFWDRRARRFHSITKDNTARDPLFQRLKSHVTAVEPNTSMLDYLRRDAHDQGLTNISPVQSTWQDAPENLSGDIVICSHVLYPIRDIVPFLAKLRAATRRACYITMRAAPIDALTAHLWRHFHGDERCLPPGYIHALDVMYELDMYADVEIIKLPVPFSYPSLDEAVEEMLEQLILPDNEQTRRELRTVLQEWLVERNDVLVPPVEEMVAAIMQIAS